MHLTPTAGFQNINFDIWKKIVEGGLYKYPIKKYHEQQSSCPPLAKVKVLSGFLTDLSA